MPPAPTGNTSGAQPAQFANLPARYSYLHRAHPGADFFQDGEDTISHPDLYPDMLTDEGLFTCFGVVMQLTFILKTMEAE
jgi:hypothetical protein